MKLSLYFYLSKGNLSAIIKSNKEVYIMEKKKLLFKTVFTTVIIPSAVNFFVFKRSNNKVIEIEGKHYKWKYGKIFYNVKGKGTPILFVHGIGAGSGSFEWNRNIDLLSKYYKIYTIDLIGFGKSDKPNMTYTAYIYCQLISDFIKDIIKEPTNVVANSLSAAFTIMATNLCPELFKRLVLICPTGIGKTNTKFTKNDRILKAIISSPIIGTSIYNFISSKRSCRKFLKDNIFFDTDNLTDETVDYYYYYSHYKNSNAKYAVASFISNYMNLNVEQAIQKTNLPIYIIWGKEASLSPISNLDIIKQLKPNIQYAIFSQVKLMPHIENARNFNKICIEFFNSNKE